MIHEEKFGITGALDIVLRDEFGNIKQEIHVPNLVVTVGKNFIASRMIGTTATVMSHMAIGTSSTTPATSNTTLGVEIGRVALSPAASVSNNVVTYVATFPAGTGTGAIAEAGILNAASAGTLLCRTVFNVVNKGSADTLTISWNVTVN